MTNITNLRERTAELSKRAYATHTGGPVDIACELDDLCDELAAVATDWQAAYDERESDMTAACMTGYELARAVYSEQIKMLREAIQAAIDCGMVPISSVKDGGAVRHSRQVQVADMLRGSLAATEPKE